MCNVKSPTTFLFLTTLLPKNFRKKWKRSSVWSGKEKWSDFLRRKFIFGPHTIEAAFQEDLPVVKDKGIIVR